MDLSTKASLSAGNDGEDAARNIETDSEQLSLSVNLQECGVCNETKEVPYKCPKCYLKYCSLNCWVTHTDGVKLCKSMKHERNHDIRRPSETGPKTTNNYRFPTEYTVPAEKLKKLSEGKTLVRLKRLLAKPHVRELIGKLDSCEDPKTQIPIFFQDPDFAKCSQFMIDCMMCEDIPGSSGSSEDES